MCFFVCQFHNYYYKMFFDFSPVLAPREQGMAGLAYYVVEVENKEELLRVFAQSQGNKVIAHWLSSAEFSLTDQDGIMTRVRVES